jgi:hypothetical protein
VLVLRRYGHLFKGTRRQAARALDEYVRQAADHLPPSAPGEAKPALQ